MSASHATAAQGSPAGAPQTVVDLLDRIAGLEVLVVGDLVLDEWLYGTARRLCREGPVPVVDVSHVEQAPGQAGNTAANAAALGAQVTCLGVVGEDGNGGDLRALLERQGVRLGRTYVDPARRTPTKRRLVTDDQMVARFDTADEGWSDDIVRSLEEDAFDLVRTADVVIVSDYGGGVLSERFRRRLTEERDGLTAPLLIDARRALDWQQCRPTVITPNAEESLEILGADPARTTGVVSVLRDSSAELLERTGAEMVITTVDSQGSLLHVKGEPPHRTRPTAPAAPLGPCGAGDTFAAAFGMAIAAGADPRFAADVAQTSADVVVRKSGTCVCTADDLIRWTVGRATSGALPPEELAEQIRQHRAAGRRVVFTNGCFDILHAGHATYLEQAARLGDVLVVALNSDSSVRRLKGPDRPVVPEAERARLVGSLDPVDLVAVFDEDSPRQLIEMVQPDVYVKGGDYIPEMLPEAELVRSLGGEVVVVDYVEDRSTTKILERIRERGLTT